MQQAFEEKAFGKPVLVPEFFDHATINHSATAGYGINIYQSATYIKIKTQGRKDTTVRKATAEDIELFKEHYTKYLERIKFSTIPMEGLAGYSKANSFTLRDLGVTSTEELSEFTGNLPTAELKLMKHCADYMVDGMSLYEPPVLNNDYMEVPRETSQVHQAQRQVLPSGEGLGNPDGGDGNLTGGVQKFGISFDEEGNIVELNGSPYSGQTTPSGQEVQEEIVQKAISFY